MTQKRHLEPPKKQYKGKIKSNLAIHFLKIYVWYMLLPSGSGIVEEEGTGSSQQPVLELSLMYANKDYE